MATFDDRAKAYEDKFAHEEELAFKITARRNHLFGLWVAGRLQLDPNAVAEYANTLVEIAVDKSNDIGLKQKVMVDLAQAGITVTAESIEDMLEEFDETARQQVQGE